MYPCWLVGGGAGRRVGRRSFSRSTGIDFPTTATPPTEGRERERPREEEKKLVGGVHPKGVELPATPALPASLPTRLCNTVAGSSRTILIFTYPSYPGELLFLYFIIIAS